jgi:hypothetical protein
VALLFHSTRRSSRPSRRAPARPLSQVQADGEIAPGAVLDSFYALPLPSTGGIGNVTAQNVFGGVRVGFSAPYGSSRDPAILTAAGPEVASFDAVTVQHLGAFFAPFGGFAGGLFIAG